MPTIEVSLRDLSGLTGKKFTEKELEEALEYVKGEVYSREGDRLKIEIADTNRPDLWSVEGIARELRSRFTSDRGLPKYEMKKSGLRVIVDKNLKDIRPKTVCAVVKGLNMTEEVLVQMIQLQEKVCETFGRKRKEVAIGVYDYHKISSPVHFKAYRPEEVKFVPLEFEQELDLRQILSMHPKGKDYAHLLSGMDKYPVFMDSKGEVLSMPPIINSDYTGKVTEETKDVFIECSGFRMKFLMPALNIMVSALAERGGRIESVEVVFPEGKIETPDFRPGKIAFTAGDVRKLSGLDLGTEEIEKLLLKSRYDVKKDGKRLNVFYPSYRQDIMHPVDVIEDIIISYGYNKIEPVIPEIAGTGKLTDMDEFSKKISDVMVGIGSQEIMSYVLTNRDNLIKKMNLEDMKVMEVDNPVSKNWDVFRTWITPSLIEVLGKNKNREYPQNIFEIGEVVLLDRTQETMSRNPTRLAWALAGPDSNFTKAKQILDFLMRSLGLKYAVRETDHPSFIPGRTGRVYVKNRAVAYIGEIHPQVLDNFGIEEPVCAFEVNLTDLMTLIKL